MASGATCLSGTARHDPAAALAAELLDRTADAVTHRHRFIGRKQTTTALIQKWLHPLKPNAYVVLFHQHSNQVLLQTPIVLEYRVNFASNPKSCPVISGALKAASV